MVYLQHPTSPGEDRKIRGISKESLGFSIYGEEGDVNYFVGFKGRRKIKLISINIYDTNNSERSKPAITELIKFGGCVISAERLSMHEYEITNGKGGRRSLSCRFLIIRSAVWAKEIRALFSTLVRSLIKDSTAAFLEY